MRKRAGINSDMGVSVQGGAVVNRPWAVVAKLALLWKKKQGEKDHMNMKLMPARFALAREASVTRGPGSAD